MNRRQFLQTGAAVVVLPVVGCGPGKGSLKGTVALRGVKLAMGFVNVITAEGLGAGGTIQADGSYEIAECPIGKLKVAVVSPSPEKIAAMNAPPTEESRHSDNERAKRRAVFGDTPVAPPPPPPPPAVTNPDAWLEIPEQYGNPDTSGLEVEVSGATVYDIVLT